MTESTNIIIILFSFDNWIWLQEFDLCMVCQNKFFKYPFQILPYLSIGFCWLWSHWGLWRLQQMKHSCRLPSCRWDGCRSARHPPPRLAWGSRPERIWVPKRQSIILGGPAEMYIFMDYDYSYLSLPVYYSLDSSFCFLLSLFLFFSVWAPANLSLVLLHCHIGQRSSFPAVQS